MLFYGNTAALTRDSIVLRYEAEIFRPARNYLGHSTGQDQAINRVIILLFFIVLLFYCFIIIVIIIY